MGGAQPLAATMNGAVASSPRSTPSASRGASTTRYLDESETDLDARSTARSRRRTRDSAVSIGVVANAVDLLERLLARNVVPDVVTDQTSAHDELDGYVPRGRLARGADAPARGGSEAVRRARLRDDGRPRRALLELKRRGAVVFDYGNNLRGQAQKAGVAGRLRDRRLRAAVHPPALLRGQGAVPLGRALRATPRTSGRTDRALLELFPQDARARALAPPRRGARRRSRGCRRASAGSATASARSAGLLFNELVRRARSARPIVIGRDHLDAGSVASPNRETEGDEGRLRRDRGLADPQRPAQHGVRARPGSRSTTAAASASAYSIHAGMVVVADGTDGRGAAPRARPDDDPGTGVMRHADAGYPEAIAAARERGVDLPFLS